MTSKPPKPSAWYRKVPSAPFLCGLLLLACAATWPFPAAAQPAEGLLEVHYIDVGQADAILVRCPDGEHYLLIDSGDTRYPGSSDAFRAYLQQEFSDKPKPWQLAVVVASHPHADHIGSMQWVLEKFEVDTYVDNGQHYDSAMFGRLNKLRIKLVKDGKLDYIDGKKTPFAELDFCSHPDIHAQIFVPWAVRDLSDTNDRSVLVRLTYGNTSFLFTGDAEAHAEEVLLNDLEEEQRDKLDVDILKAGHHGSDTSSTAEFVAAVSPEEAIVVSSGKKGVGTNSRYKHPRFSTLRTFADWFRNSDKEKHKLDGRVWAFDAKSRRWRQHTRRHGLWVTPKDGTVIIRANGVDPPQVTTGE